jgi:transcriptional antiterminator RfaH
LDADRLGVRRFIVQPLFPGYIFARFVGNDMLHKLCFTRGVHSVLSFGGVPAAIHNEIVAELQSRVDEKDGLINICVPSNVRQLTPGDRVAIKRGPMKDLVGVFEKNLKDRERIAILLTAVKYQTRVIVAPDLIRKVS